VPAEEPLSPSPQRGLLLTALRKTCIFSAPVFNALRDAIPVRLILFRVLPGRCALHPAFLFSTARLNAVLNTHEGLFINIYEPVFLGTQHSAIFLTLTSRETALITYVYTRLGRFIARGPAGFGFLPSSNTFVITVVLFFRADRKRALGLVDHLSLRLCGIAS